jgi:AraC family transcriptional regulator
VTGRSSVLPLEQTRRARIDCSFARSSNRKVSAFRQQALAAGAKCILSSANSHWSGFRLDIYHLPARSALQNAYVYNPTVGLVTAGRANVQVHVGGAKLQLLAEPGRIGLLCPEYEIKTVSWSGCLEVAYVEVCGPLLGPLAGGRSEAYQPRLSSLHGIQDTQVQTLIGAMRAELLTQCRTGRIYAESLSLALAACLTKKYSVSEAGMDKRRRARLAPAQLQLIREYIKNNFANNPSLTELAGVAQLSPYHFSRLFKNTMGITPHQYILRERIAESKTLLNSKNMPIAEIALSLGFASQSHFSDVFRKLTGRTPKDEQRAVRVLRRSVGPEGDSKLEAQPAEPGLAHADVTRHAASTATF